MSFKFLSLIIFIATALTFSSCKDADEYAVDDAFVVYLHRFEDEAATRGRDFDFENDGLILEFADLKGNDAGLCHPNERPIRIEFDRTYWNAISKKEGADLMKENLIFHELGHGPLKREHLNSLLSNGEWKSMMCGGSKLNDRAWNIDYRGVRRTYYLDELFNESTSQPSFASTEMIIDTALFSSNVLSISFDFAADAGWPLVDSSSYKTSLDNGKFCFESKVNQAFFVSFNLSSKGLSLASDFSYELSLNYPSSSGNGQYGVLMGTVPTAATPKVTESIDYFTVSNTQSLYVGNSRRYSFFTQLPINQYFIAGENKLKAFKIGTLVYVFVNGHYCYQSEIETSFQSTHIGFLAPAMSKLWIDNLKVNVKSNSNSSRLTKQKFNAPLEFSITKSNVGTEFISTK